MQSIEKQKLQKKYTIWAMIREQHYKKNNDFDENKLIELESFDTVSTLCFILMRFKQIIGLRLLDGVLTFEKTNRHALRNLLTYL